MGGFLEFIFGLYLVGSVSAICLAYISWGKPRGGFLMNLGALVAVFVLSWVYVYANVKFERKDDGSVRYQRARRPS